MAFQLVAMLGMVGLILFLFYLSWNTESEILRTFFTIMSMLALVISLNASSVIAADNGVGTNMVNLLKTSYIIGLWIFFIVSILIIIFSIVKYVNYRRSKEDDE